MFICVVRSSVVNIPGTLITTSSSVSMEIAELGTNNGSTTDGDSTPTTKWKQKQAVKRARRKRVEHDYLSAALCCSSPLCHSVTQ